MTRHKHLSTLNGEFSEQGMHSVLKSLGLIEKIRGEVNQGDIARIVDIVGVSAGVNFEGRQKAARAIAAMREHPGANALLQDEIEKIELPPAVEKFEANIAKLGIDQALDVVIEELGSV